MKRGKEKMEGRGKRRKEESERKKKKERRRKKERKKLIDERGKKITNKVGREGSKEGNCGLRRKTDSKIKKKILKHGQDIKKGIFNAMSGNLKKNKKTKQKKKNNNKRMEIGERNTKRARKE